MEDNNKPENPFAFPREISNENFEGMTLRDYFAAKAMQALISQPKIGDILNVSGCKTIEDSDKAIAFTSFRIANTMLLEREKTA